MDIILSFYGAQVIVMLMKVVQNMVATDNGFVLCLNYPSLLHFMSLSERGSVTFCTLCLVWHNHTCGSKKVGCASSAYERYEDKGRQCRGAGTWAFSIFYAEEKTER